MKHGFSKLEIILIGVILLFSVGFVVSKNLILFVGKDNLLRLRYNKYISLLNDKNYSEAYKFFSSSMKNKASSDDWIKSVKDNLTGQQTVSINKIVIQGNIGYIDRNNISCEDVSCKTKTEMRGYKQWVFENGNWYIADGRDPVCIREKMYDMPPEFVRALSLIKQRFHEWSIRNNIPDPNDILIFNCVDVQYGDTADAEGFFTFDENSSNIDKFEIKVNRSYVNSDDLLTATLLAHETKHALNYLNRLQGFNNYSCVEDEVLAFNNQLNFTGNLTTEEQNSLYARLLKDYRNPSSGLSIIWDLWLLRDQAKKICRTNQWNNCVMKEVGPLILNYVKSNPYYQKQCNLN